MRRRMFCALAVTGPAMVTRALITEARAQVEVGVEQFLQTMRDDKLFERLVSEILILREILALTSEGDPSESSAELQELINSVRNNRENLVVTVLKNGLEALPSNVTQSIDRITNRLREVGVVAQSELEKRLLEGYSIFSIAVVVVTGAKDRLCLIFPFREWCQG